MKGEITVFSGSTPLPPTLSLDNSTEVKASLPGLGETDSLKRTARDLIPETERNVLFAALRYVCSDEQLEELLVRPYEHQPRRLKESAAFELHVAWLLGLFGFSTIVLGEYERILARKTLVERASIDILAARGNSLAVIACTINAPKSVDFDTLLQAREILAREVFAGTSVQIGTMLFTGAVGYESFKELGDGFSAIPIIDVDRVGIALELLKSGLENRFFQFLANPMLSPLRSPSEEVY